MEPRAEVVIVGGGPAGLAAAQVLGRQRRSVVVVDGSAAYDGGLGPDGGPVAGGGRNAAAAGVRMLLGHDGISPAGLVRAGRRELSALPTVRFLPATATAALVDDAAVAVSTTAGRVRADYLVLATGLVDELPPIPGIKNVYGTHLFHCPLCHGFEARGQRLVVVGGSEHAAFMAAYVQDRISRDVQLCSNGVPLFSPATRTRLQRTGIPVIEEEVLGVWAKSDGLTLAMGNSSVRKYHTGFVPTGYRQRSSLAAKLGCSLTDDGRVAVDHFQRTSIPRVFAVGDMAKVATASGTMAFTATAIAGGVTAGAFLDEAIFAARWEHNAT